MEGCIPGKHASDLSQQIVGTWEQDHTISRGRRAHNMETFGADGTWTTEIQVFQEDGRIDTVKVAGTYSVNGTTVQIVKPDGGQLTYLNVKIVDNTIEYSVKNNDVVYRKTRSASPKN